MRKFVGWVWDKIVVLGWLFLLIGAYSLQLLGWFRFWRGRCRRCWRRTVDGWSAWEGVDYDLGCYEVFAWECERCRFRWTTKVWRT